MIAEELKVVIRAEVDKAVRDMKKMERQTDRSATSMDKLAKAALVFGKVTIAVTMIRSVTRGLAELSDSAADAEETFAKFGTVFADVESRAVDAMESIADSFGLADSTAANLLGSTGDLLTGFGLNQEAALELSKATTELAVDLASFSNAQGGAEAVSRALTAAYAGERESLKTYGIVMTEADVQARVLQNTMEGMTFESERQARAFATLQLAQEQSKNAIGDYERTMDSAANVSRRLDQRVIELRENFGGLASQAITPARDAISGFIEEVNQLFEFRRGVEEATTALETFYETGAAGPLSAEGINVVESQVDSLRRSVNYLSGTMESAREAGQGIPDRLREEYNRAVSNLNSAESALLAFMQANEDSNSVQEESTELTKETSDQLKALHVSLIDAKNGIDISKQAVTDYTVVMTSASKEAAEFKRRQEEIADFMGDGGPVGMAADAAADAAARMSSSFGLISSQSFGAEPAQAFTNAWQKAFDQINDEAQGGFLGGMQAAAQKIEAVWSNGLSQIAGSAMQTWSMMNQAANQRSQNELANIDAEVEAMQERHEREVAFAEAAGATDKQLAELKAQQLAEEQDAEAKADAKRKKIKKEQFQREKQLNIAQIIMDTASAVVGFLANPGGIPGIALSATAAGIGAAQLGIVQSAPPPAFEKGGSFVTSGPQNIMVGDGQSPRERVTVEPLSGPYRSGGGGNITVNFSGVVDEESAIKLVRTIERAKARGAV